MAFARMFSVLSGLFILTALVGCSAGGSALPGGTAATSDPLNQLTSGATVAGFQDFAGVPRSLSDEQLAQIEDLQAQVDAGSISPDEFSRQVHAIIGDASPMRAFAGFGFFGSPFATRFQVQVAILLNLSDEQIEQAREIFISLHEDIAALRADARERIRALLTDEQLALLDELRANRGRGARHHRFGHHGGGRILARLTEALSLTEQQQTDIQLILDELAQAIRDRHAQAREEFRAILTEDQLAFLADLEAADNRPSEPIPTTGVRPGARR